VTYNDVLPNIMPYVTINFAKSARSVIFSSVGLYFLGVLPFSTANWGVMMNQAYGQGGALYSWNSAHWLLFPMGAVILLSFGFILFAQGTDRLFNPRVRARHAKVVGDDERN
jgi:peptide/nickel transport system permease protein